ncbi:hypothetical protein NUU61_000283 [Penicillium alfredii]|uniref:Phosphoribosyltransferase domain-containing protein n=1 Tax=Penicillium alfredii TaxID=1506179 RepID=A0A9W9KPL1_9EURO|nr:uncharacterized protein NUU61_000283 [Penicillium alfredii]KAJ5114524.1 hypothetical protein NUU61_000283 [Penicillium alfredii]
MPSSTAARRSWNLFTISAGLHATVQIVVVARVVQDQAVAVGSNLMQELTRYPRLGMVALRVSANKYTGRGTTDTGNRLFNTVHLP